jgi:hypothetical protein
MQLREIALGIALGIALLALAVTFPVVGKAVELVFSFWYLGVAAIVATIVIARTGRSPDAVRVLGLVGVAWITIVVTAVGVLMFIVATGRWGY